MMNFIFCDRGEAVSNGFQNVINTIWQKEWYLYPIEVKRLFPFIICGAQRKVIIGGFGNVALSRESFKDVK